VKRPPASGLDPRSLTGATHDPHAPPPRYRSAEERVQLVIPLIPLQPPCFDRHADWVQYVVQATESAKEGDGGPLRFVHGQAQFNVRWDFCRDCLPAHASEMTRQERCRPTALRDHQQKQEKTD
jgi:hypothetical protein